MDALRRTTALASLTFLLVTAAAAESGSKADAATASWPGDAELEAQQARIGSIKIRNRPIFDPEIPGENKALFRLADRLHIDTRPSVIEAQLLFKPGDVYSRRVLDETERNLRDLRFINEPEIRVVGYRDGLVDLEVVTHEVWSTNPGITFDRTGGKNSSGIELEEVNLLGFGKYLSFDYRNNVDRSSYRLQWRDPNVFGSRWRSNVALTDSDDGEEKALLLERPFYSLDSRWSAAVAIGNGDSIQGVYRLGHRVAEYRRETQSADLRFGWSSGLRDGWARRWTAGLRKDEARYLEVPDAVPPAALPDDRDLNYPYMRYEAIQDDFETAQNLDLIARTEDLQFGMRYALELGWAATAYGSDRDAALLRAELSRGFRMGVGRSLFIATELAGRVENGSDRDALLSGQLRYFQRTGPHSTFYTSLTGAVGHELDAEREPSLGGDNGLRGYPLRYQTGSGRVLLTVEQRLYTKYTLWKLAWIGGAVFFDMGRTWGESALGPTNSLGMLKDVGFGLRLGNMRSGFGNVLHLDVAFPLDGDPSISNVQFLVQTKRTF